MDDTLARPSDNSDSAGAQGDACSQGPKAEGPTSGVLDPDREAVPGAPGEPLEDGPSV